MNLFSQNGPLTRTVGDAAVLLQTLAGFDRRDVNSLRQQPPDFVTAANADIAGLRIAWSPDFGFAEVDAQVLDVAWKAAQVFEELSCRVEEVALEIAPPYDTYGPILDADSHASLSQYLESHGDRLTGFARFMIQRGPRTTAEYAEALGQVALQKARMAELFEEFDLLLSPTACFPAFPDGEFPGERMSGKSAYPEQYWNGAFTMPINISGHAAASIPAGFSSGGMPIGLHIVGGKGGEEIVLAASAAFERARPWLDKRPPVS
jgi:aspartyl-tRNA(Asn)/glutamyl-tRNA(Gln) amidotransferase subunit A